MYMLRPTLQASLESSRLVIWDLDLRTADWAEPTKLRIVDLCHGRPVRLIAVRDPLAKMLRHFDSEVAFDRYKSELPQVLPKHAGRGRPKGAAELDRLDA
jgi:hypothetical protein